MDGAAARPLPLPAPTVAAEAGRGAVPRRRGRGVATAWLLSAPALTLMLLILVLPILLAALLSLTDYSLGGISFEWVGLQNYERIFTRSGYAKMFHATFVYVAVVVPGSILLGLLVALCINALAFGRAVYRAIYFLPVMATLVAMAIVWELALNPAIGLINGMLQSACDTGWLAGLLSLDWLPLAGDGPGLFARGCADGFPNWLGDRATALPVLCFIGIWQAVGFNMVLYMAGLTAVPRELHDAAELDGVRSGWSRFWLVTWPLLGPTHLFVVTVTTIRAFQSFDTIDALTQGGPSKSSYVMMFALFEKGVKQNLIGMASAITIVFLALVFALTLVQRRFAERRVHYQ